MLRPHCADPGWCKLKELHFAMKLKKKDGQKDYNPSHGRGASWIWPRTQLATVNCRGVHTRNFLAKVFTGSASFLLLARCKTFCAYASSMNGLEASSQSQSASRQGSVKFQKCRRHVLTVAPMRLKATTTISLIFCILVRMSDMRFIGLYAEHSNGREPMLVRDWSE